MMFRLLRVAKVNGLLDFSNGGFLVKVSITMLIHFLFQDMDYVNGTEDYGAGDWQQQDHPQVQALITWQVLDLLG